MDKSWEKKLQSQQIKKSKRALLLPKINFCCHKLLANQTSLSLITNNLDWSLSTVKPIINLLSDVLSLDDLTNISKKEYLD